MKRGLAILILWFLTFNNALLISYFHSSIFTILRLVSMKIPRIYISNLRRILGFCILIDIKVNESWASLITIRLSVGVLKISKNPHDKYDVHSSEVIMYFRTFVRPVHKAFVISTIIALINSFSRIFRENHMHILKHRRYCLGKGPNNKVYRNFSLNWSRLMEKCSMLGHRTAAITMNRLLTMKGIKKKNLNL